MSRLGPAFDAAQQRWDNLSEDDVYGPELQPQDEDFEEEMYERR